LDLVTNDQVRHLKLLGKLLNVFLAETGNQAFSVRSSRGASSGSIG
jgi:hypothetical protein